MGLVEAYKSVRVDCWAVCGARSCVYVAKVEVIGVVRSTSFYFISIFC